MGAGRTERVLGSVHLVRVSVAAPASPRFRPAFATPETALLLLVAAGAWTATLFLARGMSGMTSTMGLDLLLFVPVWTLMMTAMMLPSVAPTVSLYARATGGYRSVRFTMLVLGYLAVWAAAGLPAYGLARLAGWLADQQPGAAHGLAVAVFASCGIYQLSGLKDQCLTPLPLAAELAAALRLLPGTASQPARWRPPRRVLSGLLLGAHDHPDSGRVDERGRDGGPCHLHSDREGLGAWTRRGSAGRHRPAWSRRRDDLGPRYRPWPA